MRISPALASFAGVLEARLALLDRLEGDDRFEEEVDQEVLLREEDDDELREEEDEEDDREELDDEVPA